MTWLARSLPVAALIAAACGGGGEARYPSRERGCPVRQFPGEPTIAVDDLGPVAVDCNGPACERKLLDAVCERGGDVAWGMADNALNAARLAAHAAHSKRVAAGPREKGCAVQTFDDAPPMKTENIGPVTAWCDRDDPREVCLRILEDQVCKMGGDVMWQIDGPSREGDKQRMNGRAAHTR
jgi:hypothetical protein